MAELHCTLTALDLVFLQNGLDRATLAVIGTCRSLESLDISDAMKTTVPYSEMRAIAAGWGRLSTFRCRSRQTTSLGCNVLRAVGESCPLIKNLQADYMYEMDLCSFAGHDLRELQVSGSFSEAALMSVLRPTLRHVKISSASLSDAVLACLQERCSGALEELVIEGFYDRNSISASAVLGCVVSCVSLKKFYIDCCAGIAQYGPGVWANAGFDCSLKQEVVADLHWTSTALQLARSSRRPRPGGATRIVHRPISSLSEDLNDIFDT